MEKITIFLALFVFIFLFYSYLKLKKELLKNEIKKKKDPVKKEESLEKAVIAAVIAALMDGKKYKIRNIFLEKEKNKKSAWKISGRHYNMQRRERV